MVALLEVVVSAASIGYPVLSQSVGGNRRSLLGFVLAIDLTKGFAMADNDTLKPMQGGDITPQPSGTEFQPAAPLKDTGVDVTPEKDAEPMGTRQQIVESGGKIGQQATDKLRMFAETGKARADDALDQLMKVLNDAAGTVDDKVGTQYGQYVHQVAGTVSGYAEQLKAKDVDALFVDARALVAKSPAAAVGVAAALGFVVARLAQASLEAAKQAQ